MGTVRSFDIDLFVSLQGLELCAYMDPLVSEKNTEIPIGTGHCLLASLPIYDEYHLVYALQLGADYFPEVFIKRIPPFLTHNAVSVPCTAYNILDHLPREYVALELIDAVRQVVSSLPNQILQTFVADLVPRLEERLCGNCPDRP